MLARCSSTSRGLSDLVACRRNGGRETGDDTSRWKKRAPGHSRGRHGLPRTERDLLALSRQVSRCAAGWCWSLKRTAIGVLRHDHGTLPFSASAQLISPSPSVSSFRKASSSPKNSRRDTSPSLFRSMATNQAGPSRGTRRKRLIGGPKLTTNRMRRGSLLGSSFPAVMHPSFSRRCQAHRSSRTESAPSASASSASNRLGQESNTVM